MFCCEETAESYLWLTVLFANCVIMLARSERIGIITSESVFSRDFAKPRSALPVVSWTRFSKSRPLVCSLVNVTSQATFSHLCTFYKMTPCSFSTSRSILFFTNDKKNYLCIYMELSFRSRACLVWCHYFQHNLTCVTVQLFSFSNTVLTQWT